jgi:hypothetical protein
MASSDWVAVAVGSVSAVSAWLAGRSAKKASEFNTKTSAETEAYTRARQMDTETLERQKRDLDEVRKNAADLREKVRELKLENDQVKEDNRVLHEENAILRRRVARLEKLLGGEENV